MLERIAVDRPDVMNSTWIYPNGRWQETYSDRGGNMPYWLNGVIPMAFQLRPLSDNVVRRL